MVEVEIIIVSYNVREMLKSCLNSVFFQTRGVPFSVTVVDNASADGSAEMVEKEFLKVHLIKNERNLGFARANNQALRRAKSPYILFLNPDTFLLGDGVSEMHNYLRAQSEVALVGPLLLRPDGSIQASSYKRFPNLFTTFLEYFMPLQYLLLRTGWHPHNLTVQKDEKNPVEIAHLLGACFMVKKTAFDEMGMFDERFFIHREETDLCWRLKQRGFKIVLLPWVKIYHHGAKSTESLGISHTAASPYYLRSLFMYHQKYNPGILKTLSLAFFVLLGALFTFIAAASLLPLTVFSYKLRKKIMTYIVMPIKVFRWHLTLSWLS